MPISELVGVYDADGGLRGEAAYLWGRLRGTTHCGLCDITHSSVRRKASWDRMVASLPDRGWYAALPKPAFQPPDLVFGVMWPLSFVLLLVVGVTAIRTAPAEVGWPATGVLAVSVALARLGLAPPGRRRRPDGTLDPAGPRSARSDWGQRPEEVRDEPPAST